MAVKVLWTDEAQQTFDANIAYLNKEWADKEIKRFLQRTAKVIENITANPLIYPASAKSNNVRKAVVNKHIILYYKYYPIKKVAALLSFWNTTQSPDKLKY
ncbi:hypothetical protein CAP35_03360 [Chitinophagaceae bacterium IBVUCB1]|nr:hypothetical protein CAP35_03360 [Chitinophagaceae bacterium IBVUCB1]